MQNRRSKSVGRRKRRRRLKTRGGARMSGPNARMSGPSVRRNGPRNRDSATRDPIQ